MRTSACTLDSQAQGVAEREQSVSFTTNNTGRHIHAPRSAAKQYTMSMQDDSKVPKRIRKETEKLKTLGMTGIKIAVTPNNPRHFMAEIDGPQGTCFEGGVFKVSVYPAVM